MQEVHLEQRSTTFRDYLAVARRRKWIILQVAVLLPVIAVLLSVRQTPLYAASADVLVSRQNPAAALIGTQQSSLQADRDAQTEASLARVPAVAQRTLAAAGAAHQLTVKDFLDASSVSAAVNSDLLTFEVALGDPRRAIALATAYAQQYTRYRRSLDTDALKQARSAIEQRLVQIESAGRDAPTGSSGAPQLDDLARSALYTNLVEKDEQLRAAEALSLSKFVVVRTASEANKVRPRPVKNGLLGLALGLLLGVGLAFFKETMDTRPRSGVEIGAELGLPLLSRIPSGSHRLHKDNRLVMLADPQGLAAEAFRILRANLDLLDRRLGASRRTMMVTSAGDGEGKSTTAANLAIALAQAGRHVILVDLDLRRPSLGRLFGVQGHAGLVDVVTGRVPIEEGLASIPLSGRKNGDLGHRNGNHAHGRLDLLVGGSISVEPGDFVGSDALATTLGELRRLADVVLIDSPPLLGVGDALVLSSKVDELVVVSRLGRIRRSTINELRGVLQACHAKKLGVVLTGVDSKRMYGDAPSARAEVANGRPQKELVS